jgi:two-component system alkaline phosphatase synthesis response regulator PhoP
MAKTNGLKSKKVLLVEDDLAVVRALEKKLKQAGFLVLLAPDGAKGLRLALLEHPDVVLLDIIMPRMDGVTMLKKLRQNSWGKKVPVIILTNLTNPDTEIEAVGAKISGYLVKTDWKIEDVINIIKKVVK